MTFREFLAQVVPIALLLWVVIWLPPMRSLLVAARRFAIRRRINRVEDLDLMMAAQHAPPVSIIAAGYRHHMVTAEQLDELAAQKYPQFEIIAIAPSAQALAVAQGKKTWQAIPQVIRRRIAGAEPIAVYRSQALPNVLLVHAEASLEALYGLAINLSRYPVVMIVEPSVTLFPEALIHAVRPFLEHPDTCVAAAAGIGLAEPKGHLRGEPQALHLLTLLDHLWQDFVIPAASDTTTLPALMRSRKLVLLVKSATLVEAGGVQVVNRRPLPRSLGAALPVNAPIPFVPGPIGTRPYAPGWGSWLRGMRVHYTVQAGAENLASGAPAAARRYAMSARILGALGLTCLAVIVTGSLYFALRERAIAVLMLVPLTIPFWQAMSARLLMGYWHNEKLTLGAMGQAFLLGVLEVTVRQPALFWAALTAWRARPAKAKPR